MPIHLPHVRLGIPMLVSIAEWSVFTLYWSAAAKNSSPAKSAESRQSRCVHQLLVNAALLLAVLPIRGLGQRFLAGLDLCRLFRSLYPDGVRNVRRVGAAASRFPLERRDHD